MAAKGDLSAAQNLEEKALEGRRAVLGAVHPDTLTSMHHLAETLRLAGRLTEAQRLQAEVLRGRTRVLGDAHADTAKAREALDRIEAQLGPA